MGRDFEKHSQVTILTNYTGKKNPGRYQHPGHLIFEQIIISYVFQLRKYSANIQPS